MVDTAYFPGHTDATYELWEKDGALIQPLPQYTRAIRAGDFLTIDGTEYEVEDIEHTLTSKEDWPGPIPPAADMGYDFAAVKIFVSVI